MNQSARYNNTMTLLLAQAARGVSIATMVNNQSSGIDIHANQGRTYLSISCWQNQSVMLE